MRRELRLVADERVLGWVDDAKKPPLDAKAAAVLSLSLRELGEDAAVREVLRDGWSNGYLYFAEATP